MKGDIIKGPKGFETFARFWETAQGSFKPLKLAEDEKGGLVLHLEALDPAIFPCLGVVEDFIRTAHLREARAYDNGDVMARFEVSVRRDDCSWDGPYQLLVLMDATLNPKSYTFIHDSGRRVRIAGSLYKGHLKRPQSVFIEGPSGLMPAFERMKERDALVVGNDACDGEFMIVAKDADGYMISWQACVSPWSFNGVTKVGKDDAARAVSVYCKDGLAGVQKLQEWEVSEMCDEENRKTAVKITRELARAKDRAIREGDLVRAKCLDDIGIGDGAMDPFELSVDYDGDDDAFEQLYGHVGDYFGRDTEVWTKRDRREVAELLAYLSVWAPEEHLRKRDAMLNFGEDFACGNGAEKDLVFGEYWISRAAAAGDDYAKVWLAHIYSDPEYPFKDGATAVRWLKEARKSSFVKHDWYRRELASAEAAIAKLKVED